MFRVDREEGADRENRVGEMGRDAAAVRIAYAARGPSGRHHMPTLSRSKCMTDRRDRELNLN